ncbi:MAG: RsmB/NOP family class I SAM-dependent RNA methyltransferase [Leptolyngbyaceae cyanobacterium bins.59]|nr:RsmB/NOP family class I SAM-dependent RNA methyltransferase [Leptolyngbyaceae cyanobacterium bins.59]
MKEPSKLLLKLSQRLFTEATDRDAFVEAIVHPQPFHPCILWCRDRPDESPFATESPLPWQPACVDRLALGQRPGQHPLHQEGYFYCLDFSSVFAVSVLLAIEKPVDRVFDMCAAPGGKSLFAWVALQPKLLLSNEVIGKRTAPLIANLKRCQVHPAAVLSVDSKPLADLIPGTCPVVMVDAPCTGQSLLAKGDEAPGCFHPININKNANRQKRILANSAQLVAPGGFLAYMTCAYSLEENEQVCTWFLERFPQFEAIVVPHLSSYQSHLADFPCYRIWPHHRLGAGAFAALFHNRQKGNPPEMAEVFLQHPGVKWL